MTGDARDWTLAPRGRPHDAGPAGNRLVVPTFREGPARVKIELHPDAVIFWDGGRR